MTTLRISRRALLALGGGICCAAMLGRESRAQAVIFDTTDLTLVTLSGRYPFTVMVADTPPKVAMGLRFQHDVPPDGGMLFVANISNPAIMSISLQGVMLATDILFISQDGRVVDLHQWVRPNSASVVSTLPVAAALQLAGGTITRIGITFGDQVISPMFSP